MSDQKDQKGGREFSLEEILAEYGTKRTGAKVVDFPEREDAAPGGGEEEHTIRFPAQNRTASRPRPEDKPMAEIVPESVGRSIGARVHKIGRAHV